MAQAMEDIPRKRKEYRRQKGPVPMIAYIMAGALFVAFIVFYGPPIIDILSGNVHGSSTALSEQQ
jgi:hypothetical protein